MTHLGKYSFGIGDRFGHQARAQLKAIIDASEHSGVTITPVWNKSHREHTIIGSNPKETRMKADEAVKMLGWTYPFFVDADHVNLDTVDEFVNHSDFFTIDVASYIGQTGSSDESNAFLAKMKPFTGRPFTIPGIKEPFQVNEDRAREMVSQYLYATFMAGKTYQKIAYAKGAGNFITEVSMDEVAEPQTPVELFFILSMLAHYNVPPQTIAPKFTGRFNKGVDYVGDPLAFAAEFEANLLVIDHTIKRFGLPKELKLSIHSGSDKFAIYPHIKAITKKYDKGFHIKTAGTTWLEEVIGLALSGGEALTFVKNIYIQALQQIDALCAPYADVIDINTSQLPAAKTVESWSPGEFASALKHEPGHPGFNPNMRQLIHVAYKLAAQEMESYSRLLETHASIVNHCVYDNIYRRHLAKLFEISQVI